MRNVFIIIALLMGSATPAAAHGLFWQAGAQGRVLMAGHASGQEHGGQANEPCPAGRVEQLFTGTCAAGWSRATSADTTRAVVPAVEGAFAVVAWGWWSKTTEGSVNRHPREVPGALQAWTSRETVKHLAAGCAACAAPVGVGLEISPVGDLARLRAGRKLTLVVTLDGRPLADAVVTYDGKARGASGADGTVRLKLRTPGRQVIRASLRRPAAEPSWAEDVQTATLTFDLEAE